MQIVAHTSDNKDLIGIASALTVLRYNVTMWDKTIKPTFDMVEELHPDLVLIDSKHLNDKNAEAFTKTRVVVFGLHTPDNLRAVLNVVPNTINPALLNNVKGPALQFSTAANYAQISGGSYNKNYDSDVLLITKNLTDKTDFTVLQGLENTNYIIKYVGPVKINSPRYLGNVSYNKTYYDMLVSTKLCLDFNHHILYDSIANGIIPISNKENNYFLHHDNNPVALTNLVTRHLLYTKPITNELTNARKDVISNHTYFNRLIELDGIVNIDGCKKLAEDKIKQIYNRIFE